MFEVSSLCVYILEIIHCIVFICVCTTLRGIECMCACAKDDSEASEERKKRNVLKDSCKSRSDNGIQSVFSCGTKCVRFLVLHNFIGNISSNILAKRRDNETIPTKVFQPLIVCYSLNNVCVISNNLEHSIETIPHASKRINFVGVDNHLHTTNQHEKQ